MKESTPSEGRQLTLTATPQTERYMALHQSWIDGAGNEGVEFHLACGAGVGSPYLHLWVKNERGETRREVIDIRPMLTTWVNQVLDDMQRERE